LPTVTVGLGRDNANERGVGALDRAILASTSFGNVPPFEAERLLDGARIQVVPAGDEVGRDNPELLGILLSGRTRSYLTAADGRQLTVLYNHPGSMLSRRSQISFDDSRLRIRAITDCRVLELDRDALLAMVPSVPDLAVALIDELSARLLAVYATVADAVFGTVRQRVVRHILELADRPGPGRRAVAAITQQDIADGIGSSREFVARTIAALRDAGLIRTTQGEIELIDVRALAAMLGEWRVDTRRIEPDLTFDAERLLEASPNAVIAVDERGSVVFANTSVERVFGWPRASLVGRRVELLIPEKLRSHHERIRAEFFREPRPRPMGPDRALRGRRCDGSEFPISASLTVVETRDRTVVVVTVVELPEA